MSLEAKRIFDPDGDQSGTLVYVCDGTDAIISAHWGQDHDATGGDQKGLDLGTGIPSLNPFFAYKTASISGDTDGNGLFSVGDTIEFSIGILNTGVVTLDQQFDVEDFLPVEVTYLEHTTKVG